MKRPPRSQVRLSSSFEKVSLPKQEESEPWNQVDEVVGSVEVLNVITVLNVIKS